MSESKNYKKWTKGKLVESLRANELSVKKTADSLNLGSPRIYQLMKKFNVTIDTKKTLNLNGKK